MGLKKNGARRQTGRPQEFVASNDPVQAIYEQVRGEALQNVELPSWALERVRRHGVGGLFPGCQNDFPFILYAQSVPRPAWSGKRDFHQDQRHQVYEFLITSCAEIQEREAVGNTVDGFDASGCLPACEANVCVDALSAGSE